MNKTCRSVRKETVAACGATSKLDGSRRKAVRRAAVALALSLMAVGAAQAETEIGDNLSIIDRDAARLVERSDQASPVTREALADRSTRTLDADLPDGMVVLITNAITGIDGLQAGPAVWKGGSVDETPCFNVNSSADLAPVLQGTGYSPCGVCSI